MHFAKRQSTTYHMQPVLCVIYFSKTCHIYQTGLNVHSPVLTSHSLTVPSSEDVMTNFELNWRQVTADWCLLGPDSVCRHWPVTMSHTFTVESAFPDTKMLSRNSIPDVSDWWPIRACLKSNKRFLRPVQTMQFVSSYLQDPVSTSQTLIEVSSDPETTCTPSNWREYTRFVWPDSVCKHSSRKGFQT